MTKRIKNHSPEPAAQPSLKGKEFDMAADPFYNLEKVGSATDCTGLAPTAIEGEEASHNLGELYAIHPSYYHTNHSKR